MRARTVPVIVLQLVALAACGSRTPSSSSSTVAGAASRAGEDETLTDSTLIGTWEMVSSRVTRGDSVLSDVKAPEVRSVKVLNRTHFSFITVRRDTQFVRAAAGRYSTQPKSAAEGQYTEVPEIGSSSGLRDRAFIFTYRIEGDTWYHKGGVGTATIDEVWRRVP
jgi:hypothetical protein